MKMRRSIYTLVMTGGLMAVGAFEGVACAKPQVAASQPQAAGQKPPPASAPERPQRRGQAGALRIPDEVQVVRDVVYATARTDAGEPVDLKLDAVFLKESDDEPMPVVMYIHGGGWHSGSKQSGLQQSIALAMGGYFAVTIDYRLSGQAKFPAAIDDCKAAVQFIREHAEELGIDPDRIGVWGHSAGGHLAAFLGTSGNSDWVRTSGERKDVSVSSEVQCVVDISGPIDLRGDVAGNPIGQWLGGSAEQRDELAKRASPLSYIDAEDPPFLIVHGTDDEIVRIRHAEVFQRALEDSNVDVEYLAVEGAGHSIVQPRVYVRVAEFFDEHLGGKAAEFVRMFRRAQSAGAATGPDAQ
jgi:acetyl esterase/lipase